MVHERLEFIRKARHRTSDTNSAHVRTAADSSHPSPLTDVTLNDRPPTSLFDYARFVTITLGEIGLLVITAAITAFVHRCGEKPLRAKRLIERDHRRITRCLEEQIEQRLSQIIRLNGTTWHANNRNSRLRLPFPPEVVRHTHTAGWISSDRMDAAIRSALPCGQDRPSLWSQSVDPNGGRNRLSGFCVVAESRPITVFLDAFIRNRALDYQDKRLDLAGGG